PTAPGRVSPTPTAAAVTVHPATVNPGNGGPDDRSAGRRDIDVPPRRRCRLAESAAIPMTAVEKPPGNKPANLGGGRPAREGRYPPRSSSPDRRIGGRPVIPWAMRCVIVGEYR